MSSLYIHLIIHIFLVKFSSHKLIKAALLSLSKHLNEVHHSTNNVNLAFSYLSLFSKMTMIIIERYKNLKAESAYIHHLLSRSSGCALEKSVYFLQNQNK
jgi:hypothetical protein